MKINTLYCINPALYSEFCNEASANEMMATVIKNNGGYFKVEHIRNIHGNDHVTSVSFPKTDHHLNANGSGSTYFEIYEDEFKYFMPYTVTPDAPGESQPIEGVQSINIIVTKDNAQAMIELIQKSFGAN